MKTVSSTDPLSRSCKPTLRNRPSTVLSAVRPVALLLAAWVSWGGLVEVQGQTIRREYWTDIPGATVGDLTASPAFPDNPTGVTFPTEFEAPSDWGDNYGTRMHGYVHPPTSGSYIFWISGDDGCALSLSLDDNPANRTQIATVASWSGQREWTREANQQSVPVFLVGGQRYYVEALHKEGGGGDHVAVAWTLPDSTFEGPIPGSRLSPFGVSPEPPSISGQPASLVVLEGQSAVFAVTASGPEPMSFQWRKDEVDLTDGGNVSGAATATLTLNPVAAGDAGSYTVEVTNAFGQTTSDAAVLTVNPVVILPFLNVSLQADSLVLSFATQPGLTYIVQSSSSVQGPWVNVATATSPLSLVPSSPAGFYRLHDPDSGVYSVNTVGYLNLYLVAGDNYIANPFNTVDTTIGSLLPSVPDGTLLRKWNGVSYVDSGFESLFGGWSNPNLTLNPGEGAILRTPANPWSLTFAGEVPEGHLTVPIPAGSSLVSSPIPVAGSLGTYGFPVAEGDVIRTWDPSSNGFIVHEYFFGFWTIEPVIGLGEAFWVDTGAAKDWTQDFTMGGGGPIPQAPTIMTQPTGQQVVEGGTATFSVVASGTAPLSFQWRKDGANLADGGRISGAATASLTVSGVLPADAGSYDVVVGNAYGMATGAAAALTVDPVLQPLRIESISLLGGFVVLYFTSQEGASYFIESSADLTAWGVVTGVTGSAGLTSLQLSAVGGGPAAFYRIQDPDSGVYSVNTVGYLNLYLVAGDNYIANPFNTVDTTIGSLLPSVPDGTLLRKWNGVSYVDSGFESLFGGWSNPNLTLNSGEGAILRNPTSPWSLTFVGEVPEGHLTVPIPAGSSLVSSPVPVAGSLGTFGFPVAEGDRIRTWDPGSASFQIHNYAFGGWDVEPVIGLGEAFWVDTGAARDWTQDFTVGGGGPSPQPPTITAHPASQQVVEGGTATFSVVASGTAPLSFQWRKDGANLAEGGNILGVDTPALTLNPATLADTGSYSLEITNAVGWVRSLPAVLKIGVPAIVLQEPVDRTVSDGATTSFSVSAQGTPPLAYRWSKDGVTLPGAVGPDLVVSGAGPDDEGGYSVEVSNGFGATSSRVAMLNVLAPPQILVQPAGQAVAVGGLIVLSVEVTGDEPFEYQWQVNGANLNGATDAVLTMGDAQWEDSGSYSVVVVNPVGSAQSAPAEVQVGTAELGIVDAFADRPVLADPARVGRGSNVGATREPGEPEHGGWREGASVWLGWQAPANGILTVSTRGSGFDTVLSVYAGDDLSSLQGVAWDDDNGGFLTSEAVFAVVEGEVYSIAVDGFGGEQGPVVMSWALEATEEQVPVVLAGPDNVTVGLGQATGLQVTAAPGGLSYQWFKDGTPIPGATDPLLQFPAVQLEDIGNYRALVSLGPRSVWSPFAALQVNLTDQAVEPGARGSDKFAMQAPAQVRVSRLDVRVGKHDWAGFQPPVRGWSGLQVFSTVGYGKEEGEPNHGGRVGGASGWFSIEAERSGRMLVTTEGSDFDTVLAVYRGPAYPFGFEELEWVAEDDNSGADGVTSRLVCPAVAGEIYHVAVDGVGGASGQVRLVYEIGVEPAVTGAPQGQEPELGETLALTLEVISDVEVTYEWWQDGVYLGETTEGRLDLGPADSHDSGTYVVKVKSFAGEQVLPPVTVKVMGPDTLRFGARTGIESGGYRVEVRRPLGGQLVLEWSTDLKTWERVWPNAPLGEVVDWLDDQAVGQPVRFYRARLVP